MRGKVWNCYGRFDVYEIHYAENKRLEKLVGGFIGNAREEQSQYKKPVYYYPLGSSLQRALDSGQIEHYWYNKTSSYEYEKVKRKRNDRDHAKRDHK
jgi:hypothetical protein